MNLILFGFKGSGKTHLGKLLSRKLMRPFIDTDDLVGQMALEHGPTVREIHQKLGEEVFRKLEKEAIFKLDLSSDAVIAVGGGAVLNLDSVDHLQKIGKLVYLKASFNTIQKRIFSQNIPSFVDGIDPFESLHQIYLKRLPIYESIIAEKIDVDLLDESSCIAALRSIVYLGEQLDGL